MKYRKKLVVVEAFQMTREALNDPATWPAWLRKTWGCLGLGIGENDYVIRSDDGQFSRCDHEIFEMDYEAVRDAV